MSFDARTERVGSAAIVKLHRRARHRLRGARGGSARGRRSSEGGVLVADLRELTFIDSTGVRVLLVAHLHATKKGMTFGVARGADGMVRKLLEVTRIDQRFPVVEDPAVLTGDAAAQ